MITDYTGLPYDFRRYNCWHHVRRVRGDVGIQTPEFGATSPRTINDAFDAGHADTQGLTPQETPQDYDVVLMGYKQAGRIVWHSGIWFDGMVSHCELAARQVRLETIIDVRERYPIIRFWR